MNILLSKQKCMVLTSDPQSSQFEQMILSTQIKYFTKYEHTESCLLTLDNIFMNLVHFRKKNTMFIFYGLVQFALDIFYVYDSWL